MENMKKEHADATQDGKEQNVQFATMNVKFRTVTTMATVWLESVSVVEDIQDNSANLVCTILYSCLLEYQP